MTAHNPTHALISVSDKTGIIEFAGGLIALGIHIISTGGTASLLKQHHIPVTEVADFTGFPEIMGGRVKTLHPKIYAGILARSPLDQEILNQYKMPIIGLVVVNLYPFEKTVAKANCPLEEAIENIDIGGPTLLRAAAKNYSATTVMIDPGDYDTVLSEIKHHHGTTLETRFHLAQKVFAYVAKYDAAISNYFFSTQILDIKSAFPDTVTLQFQKKMDLRYGENPHQKAAFYAVETNSEASSMTTAQQHLGKPLSYNNMIDADTALECVSQFQEPACVIVKHANPCAVSLSHSQRAAYQNAYKMDPISAFGGIIAFNTLLEANTVQDILTHQFVEVIIAPNITPEASAIAESKPNVRLLAVGPLVIRSTHRWDLRSISGGILMQDCDQLPSPPHLEVVSKRVPTEDELNDLLFAWQVVRFVKSNAIVYAKNKVTLGIGAGQMSRVFSTQIAALKAKQANASLEKAVMASDAFFPFRDGIDQAATLGISAIIQPGGSIRDREIIQAADEKNMVMVFTRRRHFRH